MNGLNKSKWADPQTKIWRTGDGELIHVENMSELHIRKVVEFLKMNYINTAHSCIEWTECGLDCSNEHMIEQWARTWVQVLESEWARRGFRVAMTW